MRNTPRLSLVAIFLFILIESVSAQLIYIPSNDPIVSQIEELQVRGYLSDLSETEKPWLVSDVEAAVAKEEISFDPLAKALAVKILRRLNPPQREQSNQLSAAFVGGLGLRALSREKNNGYFYQRDILIDRGYSNEFGSVYKAGFWLSRESHWGWDTELIFDSDGTRYPWYFGTAHTGHIIGQFDHAYLTLKLDSFGLLFGRERLVWGPSPRGSILLDDSSPPLDMIGYNFALKPFHLSGFGARLDDYVDPSTGVSNRRYLTGHRLIIKPGKEWEIGLSEIYVYGGPQRLPELYYSIPIVLYYWEAQNHKVDDNAFWGLDIAWTKKGLGRFYTQFNADDIQRQHRGPQKFAMQFGTYLIPDELPGWSGIFELNIIDTYVFGQRKRYNAYLDWGWPMSRLDSDQREYFAGVYKRLGSDLRIGAEFVGRDKGQYDAADIQPGMAPFGIKFPSGVVEWTRQLGLAADWQTINGFNAHIAAGYQSVTNFRHQPGASPGQLYAQLQLSYDFSLGLPFWTKFQ
jgi:hypothetical protein